MNARGSAARRRSQQYRESPERWREGLERSRRRREGARTSRRRRRRAIARGIAVAGVLLLAGGAATRALVGQDERPTGAHFGAEPAEARSQAPRVAIADRIAAATRFARARGGLVSFAVLDADGLRGHEVHRPYVCASVVKAMLLAAELRRLRGEGLPLDRSTRATLESMVTVSDNAAADAVYSRVGDEGLARVADQAGMTSFDAGGYWANAQITAADQARFFYRLDRNLVGPHREFARHLLRDIGASQRWGVFDAAPRRSRVYAKGGWRATELGSLAHQAARIELGRRSAALVVLTDAQPSHDHAVETVEGVARRLLRASAGGA